MWRQKDKMEKIRLEKRLKTYEKEIMKYAGIIEREKRAIIKDFDAVRRTSGNSRFGLPPSGRLDNVYAESSYSKSGVRLSEKRLMEWKISEKELERFLKRTQIGRVLDLPGRVERSKTSIGHNLYSEKILNQRRPNTGVLTLSGHFPVSEDSAKIFKLYLKKDGIQSKLEPRSKEEKTLRLDKNNFIRIPCNAYIEEEICQGLADPLMSKNSDLSGSEEELTVEELINEPMPKAMQEVNDGGNAYSKRGFKTEHHLTDCPQIKTLPSRCVSRAHKKGETCERLRGSTSPAISRRRSIKEDHHIATEMENKIRINTAERVSRMVRIYSSPSARDTSTIKRISTSKEMITGSDTLEDSKEQCSLTKGIRRSQKSKSRKYSILETPSEDFKPRTSLEIKATFLSNDSTSQKSSKANNRLGYIDTRNSTSNKSKSTRISFNKRNSPLSSLSSSTESYCEPASITENPGEHSEHVAGAKSTRPSKPDVTETIKYGTCNQEDFSNRKCSITKLTNRPRLSHGNIQKQSITGQEKRSVRSGRSILSKYLIEQKDKSASESPKGRQKKSESYSPAKVDFIDPHLPVTDRSWNTKKIPGKQNTVRIDKKAKCRKHVIGARRQRSIIAKHSEPKAKDSDSEETLEAIPNLSHLLDSDTDNDSELSDDSVFIPVNPSPPSTPIKSSRKRRQGAVQEPKKELDIIPRSNMQNNTLNGITNTSSKNIGFEELCQNVSDGDDEAKHCTQMSIIRSPTSNSGKGVTSSNNYGLKLSTSSHEDENLTAPAICDTDNRRPTTPHCDHNTKPSTTNPTDIFTFGSNVQKNGNKSARPKTSSSRIKSRPTTSSMRQRRWTSDVCIEYPPAVHSQMSLESMFSAALVFSRSARKTKLNHLVDEFSPDVRERVRQERISELKTHSSHLSSLANSFTIADKECDK